MFTGSRSLFSSFPSLCLPRGGCYYLRTDFNGNPQRAAIDWHCYMSFSLFVFGQLIHFKTSNFRLYSAWLIWLLISALASSAHWRRRRENITLAIDWRELHRYLANFLKRFRANTLIVRIDFYGSPCLLIMRILKEMCVQFCILVRRENSSNKPCMC